MANEPNAQSNELVQFLNATRHREELKTNLRRSEGLMEHYEGVQANQIRNDNMQTPFFLAEVPYLHGDPEAVPVENQVRQESDSEKKKRQAMQKQYRKADAAVNEAVTKESIGDAIRIRRTRAEGNDDNPVLMKGEYKTEKEVLDRWLTAIDETEKADILAVELKELQTGNKNKDEVKRAKVRYEAQQGRIRAYHRMAEQMPLDSKERRALLKQAEKATVKGKEYKKRLDAAEMPEGKEKTRALKTIKRHRRYDILKGIFRSETVYSREDAELPLQHGEQQLNLLNKGRATLGGTKAMYEFEDMQDQGNQWLFKEATNCVGIHKPEGAIVTQQASVLQQRLRGELSIPAYCLRDEKTGKVCGSIQKRIGSVDGGVDLFKWQAKQPAEREALPENTKADLMQEHTLDWMLCNFDTKGENFMNQENGHIISYDKEASFNTLLQDGSQHMSYTYKPHSNDTIYNTIFQSYVKGEIDLDLNANMETIQRVEQMGPDAFVEMFRETLNEKYFWSRSRRKAENRLRERVTNLRKEYCIFYTRLIQERIAAIGDRDPQEVERLNGMLENGRFRFSDGVQPEFP